MDATSDLAIADLLEQSRAAHQRYREQCARMIPDGSGGVVPRSGDPVEARRCLMAASAYRQGAEASDPLFESDAWMTEPSTHNHADLMAFYATELVKDVPVPLTVETLRVIAQRDVVRSPIGPQDDVIPIAIAMQPAAQ